MKKTILAGMATITLMLAGAAFAATAPTPGNIADDSTAPTPNESLETTTRRCPPFCG